MAKITELVVSASFKVPHPTIQYASLAPMCSIKVEIGPEEQDKLFEINAKYRAHASAMCKEHLRDMFKEIKEKEKK